MDFSRVKKALEDNGFAVSEFATAAEASLYLNRQIDQTTVGFGGSMTLEEMGLYDSLSTHNEVRWHHRIPEGQTSAQMRSSANEAEIYIASVNGLAESGEVINIDYTGNRVAALLYGPKKAYLVVGENKIAPDYDSALWRARNIAGPKNAARLHVKTPCAVTGRCSDCKSPARICRGLTVLWKAPAGMPYEVILIHETLGY